MRLTILSGLILLAAGPRLGAAKTCCYTYTYCSHTCHYCGVTPYPDNNPKTLSSLPLQANYSHEDSNNWNDVCSSGCGTSNCRAPTTLWSEDRLPSTKGGACYLSPNNQLPTQMHCKFNDGYCSVYCDATATATWCTSCP